MKDGRRKTDGEMSLTQQFLESCSGKDGCPLREWREERILFGPHVAAVAPSEDG